MYHQSTLTTSAGSAVASVKHGSLVKLRSSRDGMEGASRLPRESDAGPVQDADLGVDLFQGAGALAERLRGGLPATGLPVVLRGAPVQVPHLPPPLQRPTALAGLRCGYQLAGLVR